MISRLAPRGSLRWRLPLLISLLIAVVLGAFAVVSYQAVRRTLVEMAGLRATEAANQVAAILAQAGQQRRVEMLRVARDPMIREVLRGNHDNAAAAKARLATLALPNALQRIELWTAAGTRVLALSLPSDAVPLPDNLPPSVAVPKVLRVNGSSIFSEAFVPISASPDDGETGPGDGFIVIRRPIGVGSSDAVNRLIGSGALIEIGNTADDVWTDLTRRVPAPAVDLARRGAAQVRVGGDGRRIGALAVVGDSPWAVWLDFPEAKILAPARRFLQWLIAAAVVCTVIAALLTAFITAGVTTPLTALTQASEAIAAGDYHRQVDSSRRDELGRLGAAFNAMARQVEAMHHDLEAQVQQRTARLTEAMQQLETVNGELEAFSYSVSHDLRAPLRHVTGFASLLEQRASPSLDPEARRYVTTIVDAANRMGRLIDDLLAFSRIGRTPLALRDVDLAAAVEEAQRDAAAAANGRRVEWTIDALPRVQADPALLRQVLLNLLSNAVKYTATQPVAQIAVGAQIGADGHAIVSVRDNGVGFDPQYAHKLFGVFQRLHSTDQFEGSGIGLANVKRIIQRHGGRAWAEGCVGGGATFYFSLPQAGEQT